MSGIGGDNGWLEAAIAWEVCASLHRQYCKGKDNLFTTRQADFVKHAENARRLASHGQAPAQPAGPCAICGSDEPFTDTCGSGDSRALCKQPLPAPLADRQQAPAGATECRLVSHQDLKALAASINGDCYMGEEWEKACVTGMLAAPAAPSTPASPTVEGESK